MEDGDEEEAPAKPSLFPVFAGTGTAAAAAPNSGWLSNSSFTTNLSVIDETVSSLHKSQIQTESDHDDDEESSPRRPQLNPPSSSASYQLLEEEENEEEEEQCSDSGGSDRKKKKRRGKRDTSSRKRKKRFIVDDSDARVRVSKDYYFDSHGDADNLVYGSIYRMNVPRYKPYTSAELAALSFRGLYRSDRKNSVLDRDSDIDSLDIKLKSNGRYWSAKYAAVESNKNLKRLRLLAPERHLAVASDDFIPLFETKGDDRGSVSGASVVEESWEDEVLRKTREFNKLTRERPHDEKVWMDFAEFQDKVANKLPQRGARLQMLEKKISIIEKAVELNPDNEELLVYLLKAYQRRDSSDVLIARWEKVLTGRSGSAKLWKEYLRVFQGEFSRFKVSDVRKMYAHAIQALSSASSKQFRQVYENAELLSTDPTAVQLELGLVDVFLSFCRFEWQAGYKELATALFQAEIEFSLFCPSLRLSEHGKLRLFEHFWNGNGPRIGEDGAVGWSSWLEKEEENRQSTMKEEAAHNEEKGGWTGWSEPISKHGETDENQADVSIKDSASEEDLDESHGEEDDTEALLKQLGIDVDAAPSSEVTDTSTWLRWSEEESLRDCKQWMPVHGKSEANSEKINSPERETDDQFLRAILFEDICEYLFSLSSEEARFSLISQFIEFFGGDMSQWICSNSSSYAEKILSLEMLPDSVACNLGSSNTMISLLGGAGDVSKQTDCMKFLRNAILLCLTAFPRNHVLEEAALVAEDFSVTRPHSSTPCRALAKSLLKSDRQDILLCGVYARREAASGNIDHARRVFDMALLSIEGLPKHLQSDAPLLYFWYAEFELANSSANAQESSCQTLHILSCLGSGAKYHPFECKPSSLQLLRAHQGFKEKIRTVQSAWMRGVINDHSIALTCSAVLFEELTTGWEAGVQMLDEAFNMVLPERRRHSNHLEFLFSYYLKMLFRHHKQTSSSKLWESIMQGLQLYPCSSEVLKALLEISNLYRTPNKLRLVFDDYCQKKPPVIVWIFMLAFEMNRGGSRHRIHGLFERALANENLHNSVILWRLYVAYEIDVEQNPIAARRIFFRAIHACPWSKRLWLDGFLKLNSILTAKELSDLQEVMRDKELNLRTDIYEILLQDQDELPL
ncbi:Nuclear exosome regulator NRDE2 [Euphorbia peplus]|nr:Nuclear exosome regulator NRDE2 [Euphorbia peplus]